MAARRPNWSGLSLVAIGILILIPQVLVGLLLGFDLKDVTVTPAVPFLLSTAAAHGCILAGIWFVIRPILFPRDPDEV